MSGQQRKKPQKKQAPEAQPAKKPEASTESGGVPVQRADGYVGKNGTIVTICCIALSVVLAIVAGVAWINFSGGSSKVAEYLVGKVDYQIPDSVANLFYSEFEVEEDDYEETPDIDEYIHAATVAVGVKNTDTPITVYSLEQDTTIKFAGIFDNPLCTDSLSWSSSQPANVTVSNYGTVRAVGIIGSFSDITLTVINNDPDSPDYRDSISATVRVTVIKRTVDAGSETIYADLPAGTNILRQSMTVDNYSGVPSKLRLKLRWIYTSITEDEEDGISQDYTVDALIEAAQTLAGTDVDGITFSITDTSPLQPYFTTDRWHHITPDGKMIFTTSDGVTWSAELLRLTAVQYQALVSYLAGQSGSFSFSASMINEAYTYYCCGVATGPDYGDVIPPAADEQHPNNIPVLDRIIITDSYSAYSTKRLFTISLTMQARQYKAYMINTNVEDPWYDVACITNEETIPSD